MNIKVLDGYGLNPGDLSWKGLEALGNLTVYDRTPEELIIERAANADALLTNKTIITSKTLQSLPRLKYIGVLATGYNVVDIKAAKELGIVVTNIPAYSTASVAQMVFAHVLEISQHVEHYSCENRKGRWTRNKDFCYWDFPLIELAGKSMGIIGLGNTGQATARIAKAFGMEVHAYTSKPAEALPSDIKKATLDNIFSNCDIISLHCPLTEDTKNLIDARRLKMMKPSAILINTGRGPLINEQDLADALNNGTIYAAGLDVLSSEPPHKDNPLLSARNCYITPHIAWATKEARTRLMEIATENLQSFINGKVKNSVNC